MNDILQYRKDVSGLNKQFLDELDQQKSRADKAEAELATMLKVFGDLNRQDWYKPHQSEVRRFVEGLIH